MMTSHGHCWLFKSNNLKEAGKEETKGIAIEMEDKG